MSQHPHTDDQKADYGRVFRHDNGIVYIYLIDDISIDLQKAQALVAEVRALDSSGQARLLVRQGNNNDLSFEAQRFLGTVKGLTHLALVVHSRLQADVAQIFVNLLNLLNSSYRMQVFHSVTAAEAWLL